jgi:hypothetical protein
MTPKTVGGLLVVGLIIAFSFLAGCTNEIDDNSDNTCSQTDYDNGIIYFGCTQANFAMELSAYIEKHNVTIVAISPVTHNVGYNTPIKGYFVVVEKME